MLTPNEAYLRLLKSRYNSLLFMKCRSCLDFGSFYSFCVAPMDVNDEDDYFTGTVFESVNKTTGEIFDYDITSDLDAYEKAKVLSVDTFWDIPSSKLLTK